VGADSIIRTTRNDASVVTGNASRLNSVGSIVMSARGTGDVRTKVNVESFGGVAAVVDADTVSDLRPVNKIDIGTGTLINADGDLKFSAGTNTNFNRDQYNIEAITDSFAGAAIPIDSVNSDATLLQTNTINVRSGSVLNSAGDVMLHAERLGLADMNSQAKGVNWASAAASAVNSMLGGQELIDGDITTGATGVVTVDGTVNTGTKRNRYVQLGFGYTNGDSGGWDPATGTLTTITVTPGMTVTQGKEILSSGLFAELANARTNLERYRNTDTKLRNFYQSEINRIQSELIADGLGVLETDGSFTAAEVYVMTASIEPLRAQAGIIDIRGDALVGS
jgi:hypothetical protein